MVHGKVNGWSERIRCSWNSSFPLALVAQLKTARALLHEQSCALMCAHREVARRAAAFNDVYRREVDSLGPTILGEAGVAAYMDLLVQLDRTFRNVRVPEKDVKARIRDYLHSGPLDALPFVRVGAMLWAAVARKYARGGRKKPPTRGLVTYSRMVSLLLPYCDAMLIDNEIAGYLREQPLASSFEPWAKVFSPKTRDSFHTYLESIEAAVPPDNLALVAEIYGSSAPIETVEPT